jgi:threonylcarbamoyladenosine tRNA methylthiotransferase MtaB
VLIEANQLGRTEAFTPVRFRIPVERGDVRDVRIAGHDGRELVAA